MERIIKEFWEDCKSWFVKRSLDKIWALLPIGNMGIVMSTLAQIQFIPSFYWIPITFGSFYFFIVAFDFIGRCRKSPFEVLGCKVLLNSVSSLLEDSSLCIYKMNKYVSSDDELYTIFIRTNGKKTIKYVSVMLENDYAIHKETNKKQCNLNPNATEQFIFHLPKNQKEVKITVTGEDTISLTNILFIKPPASPID
jgi:hypothetical protein